MRKVVVYVSHYLKVHERNYLTYDLKLKVIVLTLKIWRHYLYGIYDMFSDDKSMRYLFYQKELHIRQGKW